MSFKSDDWQRHCCTINGWQDQLAYNYVLCSTESTFALVSVVDRDNTKYN